MIDHLISDLARKNILIDVLDGELIINAPKGALTSDLLERIKKQKSAIVGYLSGYMEMAGHKAAQIPVVQASHCYPLSSSQYRLWILSQQEESSIAYNMPGAYVFKGKLDISALSHSLHALIKRHEILRTAFREDEQGDIKQFIHPAEAILFDLSFDDVSQEDSPEDVVRVIVNKAVQQPFDLLSGVLLRAGVCQVADDEWVFYYVLHHIAGDAWSLGILIKELLVLYNAYINGEKYPLSPLRIQYKDYAAWELQRAQSLAPHKAYWQQQLAGELPMLELPADKIRPASKTFSGGSVRREINASLSMALNKLCQQQGASLFMGLLSLSYALLHRYSGQDDIIIGSPVAGRDHSELETQIGCYVNTLALRAHIAPADGFGQLLGKVKAMTMDAFEHQAYPFDSLVDDLSIPYSPDRNALFDVMVLLQQETGKQSGQWGLNDLAVSLYQGGDHTVSKFDLVFSYVQSEQSIWAVIEYNSDLYTKSFIEKMAAHLEGLLRVMLANPAEPISGLNYLSAQEQQQLLVTFNNSGPAYEDGVTVLDLFSEQVLASPDVPAVVYNGKSLSYAGLNDASNRFAAYLHAHYGISAGSLAAIILPGGEQMITAILGILKCGAAYVPVDMNYPQDRIGFMIKDSQCKVVVDAEVWTHFESTQHLYPASGPQLPVTVDNDAYVIYTSGSTGLPKGCMISHANLSNYIRWANNTYLSKDKKASFALFTSLSFDLTVTSIFCTLTQGGTLTIYGQEMALTDIIRHQFSAESGVNCIKLTPSHINLIKSLHLSSETISCAIVGGEQLTQEQVRILKRINPAIKVYNEYGPTETTVGCIVKEVEDTMPVLIGKPIAGTKIYILNEANAICPVGIPGEIYISGAGVGRGYLHQPAFTATKFIADPFHEGKRMYKTGDFGQWLPDGDIKFLGRKDDQFKIRGYRIETGEVEKVLLDHPDIDTAAVIVRTNLEREHELVAYFTAAETLSVEVVRAYLAEKLPAYFLPGYYVQLQVLPITINGKLDRKQLPDPDTNSLSAGNVYIAPRNETERQLVSIWEKVLRRDKIGVNDNFLNLGGNSLKSIRLVSEINKAFEVRLSFPQLFTAVTISGQALLIAGERKTRLATIPFAAEQDHYPLSAAQRRLWVLSQFEESSIAYHMPGIYVLEGELDRWALEQAFTFLQGRHEILRTVFAENGQGEICQFIRPVASIISSIPYIDLRHANEQEPLLMSQLREMCTRTFKLEEGPLLRAGLWQLENNKWVFAYVIHHIISDGWSLEILISELMQLYGTCKSGVAQPLQQLDLQYKDYASWQEEQMSSGQLESHKNYWLQQFSGELPVLELAGDHPRPAVKTYHGGLVRKIIDPATAAGLKALLVKEGVTLFMGLLAVVKALLYRYTGQQDIIAGTAISGRQQEELSGQLGLYLNTLPLRTRFSGTDTFTALLATVKQITLSAYEHQAYPFDELVDDLKLPRNMSRNALFDIFVLMQEHHLHNSPAEVPGGLIVSSYKELAHNVSKFDLTFNFMDAGEALQVGIEYNSDIFDYSTIERLAGHFESLIQAIVKHPSAPINTLSYLPEHEQQQLLSVFNNATPVNTGADKHTIISLFEEQVAAQPDGIALVCDEASFTYQELNEKSNQVARYLMHKYAVGADDLIAIQAERNAWMVIAMLGILKSGAAYVPIEPAYPAERTRYILEDSGCITLLDERALETIKAEIEQYGTDNPPLAAMPGNLAYVTYTSGSTGKPKGVMIAHRNVTAFIDNFNTKFFLERGMLLAATTSYTFDISVLELLGSLVYGMPLYLLRATDPATVLAFLQQHQIDVLQVTPSRLSQLMEVAGDDNGWIEQLSVLLVGGEALGQHQYEVLKKQATTRVINVYGPTETTIWSSAAELSSTDVLSIGTPLLHENIYILDEEHQLVPVGVVGEICISGSGVARGYLNRPELTAEKIISDPFVAGERMYKTGDAGKWLPDGSIAFCGRKDEQVKIRGHRIEPGEIEWALQGCPGIDAAVVLAVASGNNEKELVAYLVSSVKPAITTIRERLATILPVFMLPGYFIYLDELPLNSNGKVDRKKLPALRKEEMLVSKTYIAPATAIEKELAALWCQVLDVKQAGMLDNFFELGGHSLKATRLANQIYKKFEVRLPLQELFAKATLAEQTKLITSFSKTTFTAIPRIPDQSGYELSAAQHRLWILSQFEESNVAYNLPGVYLFEGNLDLQVLSLAFTAVIARHEILRTVFREDEQGDIKQYVLPPEAITFSISNKDISAVAAADDQLVKMLVEEETSRMFDLATGPLLRAAVLQTADNKWVFIYTIHHIIADGWSLDILLNEILLLYNVYASNQQAILPPLPIQYRDYAAWQREQLRGESLLEHRSWWLKQFEGELPVLELPCDKVRPAVKTFRGGTVTKRVDAAVSKGIKAIGQTIGSTLFMNLLTAVNILLYRYTHQEDIIIGSPVAGREHADLEDQIGLYVNTLALRTKLNGTENFMELLGTVREHTLQAFEHQLYPFDELVDELNLRRDMSRNALFDVMLVLQNNEIHYHHGQQHSAELAVTTYKGENIQTSKFDLLFNFVETGEQLQVDIEYNSDIFHAGSIQRLGNHLVQLLEAIIANPFIPVASYDYLSLTEKEELLHTFNDTVVPYPENRTVIDMFEEQVLKIPDSRALVFEETAYTYRQLNEKANQLARYLLNTTGIQQRDCIAVLMDRSEWSAISMISIMKLGCTYVPVDGMLPAARIRFILEESCPRIVLVNNPKEETLNAIPEIIPSADISEIPGDIDAANIGLRIHADESSFIIYTSGSTGNPKGVEQTHRTLYNLIEWDINGAQFNSNMKHLQFSSFSFDSSLHDIYYVLATGGEVHIINELLRRDLWSLKDYVLEKGITTLSMPYAALKAMFSEIPAEEFEGHQIEEVISTGEQLYVSGGLRTFLENNPLLRLYNLYGPSETHVVTGVSYRYADAAIPEKSGIGKPIHNTNIYVLDHRLQLVPVGVQGEIYIGGWNLAKGYYGNRVLTDEKFIADPYCPGKIIYRSGDIGKWLPDGSLEYISRRDNQIKINGYRMELGEIESALRGHELVEEAIVVASALSGGDKQLVAYLVSKTTLDTKILKSYLAAILPGYMIPHHFIQLAALPLTPNGKVDKRKLPVPTGAPGTGGAAYVAPGNETEEKLTGIWSEILGLEKDKIGVNDNFFDLGGHSLKATRLISRIKKEFGTEVRIREVFAEPTIAAIALKLDMLVWLKNEPKTGTQPAETEELIF